jgi:PadR family transcriptional regulator, regulatory protein PadR
MDISILMIFSRSSPRSPKSMERLMLRHMFSVFLLWYISKHKAYGYELIKRFDTEKGFRLTTASQLYPMLKGLLRQGLLTQEREMQGRRVRKLYRVTAEGKRALAEAKRCMRQNPLKLEFLREMIS